MGDGSRKIARMAGPDRKTVRRYIAAAERAGLTRQAGGDQITDELLGQIVDAVRPARPGGHGQSWQVLLDKKTEIEGWLDQDLTVVKIQDLLAREGKPVAYTTLRRFCAQFGRGRKSTVRIDDCEPGSELQVDFGKLGVLYDLEQGRNRAVWALVFTAVYSRHVFVYLSFRQTLACVIDGFEAAWPFFGGVFKVVIPDNLKPVIDKADPTNPKLNQAFLEYSQSIGFVVDAARVRHPQDKARVERSVPFVRNSFFKGEHFVGLSDAQRRAELWCLGRAGLRIHRTTQRRPAEVFDLEEKQHLLAAPSEPYDLPIYADPKVHKDHHIEVAKSLYSVPGDLIGQYVKARADRHLVRVYHRGKLIKTHPRKPPGERSTDANDLPSGRSAYAMRDLEHLKRSASFQGRHVGLFAEALLDNPLPWTKMRQVYRLLGLARRFEKQRVDEACRQALEFEAIDVKLVGRMLEKDFESRVSSTRCRPAAANVVPLRFARSKREFRVAPIDGQDQ